MSCIFRRQTGPQPPAHTWNVNTKAKNIPHTRAYESFLHLLVCSFFCLGHKIRQQCRLHYCSGWHSMKSTILRNVARGNVDVTRRIYPMSSVSVHLPMPEASVALSAFGVGFNFQTKEMWGVSIGWQACLVMRVQSWLARFFAFFSQSFSHTIQSQGTRHNGNKNTISFESLFFLFHLLITSALIIRLLYIINAYIMTSMGSCFSCFLFSRVTHESDEEWESHYDTWMADCDRKWRRSCERKQMNK